MPTEFYIDREVGVVFTLFFGDVTTTTLFKLFAELKKDPQFDPRSRELADMREVISINVPWVDMRKLSLEDPWQSGACRAFVAPRDVVYGTCRVIEATMTLSDQHVEVFRDMLEARKWLGLPH